VYSQQLNKIQSTQVHSTITFQPLLLETHLLTIALRDHDYAVHGILTVTGWGLRGTDSQLARHFMQSKHIHVAHSNTNTTSAVNNLTLRWCTNCWILHAMSIRICFRWYAHSRAPFTQASITIVPTIYRHRPNRPKSPINGVLLFCTHVQRTLTYGKIA